MCAELGVLFLILSLLWASLIIIIPLFIQKDINISYYVCGLWASLSISYLCLTYCFLTNDFSVLYVLKNSSTLLPWFYKLCAVWGGHEGSMLLWVCVLSSWMLGVNFFSKSVEPIMRTRVLIVLSALCIGFIVFLLGTSNPFLRQFQVLNTSGKDLNPLLQDPGFLFHPPMLYMGYVGFAVAFAFAIASLWTLEIQTTWLRWVRPWTLAAWCCLTLGITLGSWWAYRELGWGGWWFWDPVENASFMPWLIGTAFLHASIVSEKRQQFIGWTLLLAIFGFSLSLIGTFLVRSGVLTSVHAFAVDPARGLFILFFLFIVIGGSLLLFALRINQLQQFSLKKNHTSELISRDSSLLLNNVFLFAAMLTILTGTLYPLIIDGLGLGKISVGAPYFNAVFVPLMIPLLFLMGLGIHFRWQKDSLLRVIKLLLIYLILSILIPLCLWFFGAKLINLSIVLGVFLSAWIILTTALLLFTRIKTRGLLNISLSFWGMFLAHIGVAISVIGITISSGYGVSKELKMTPGDMAELSGFVINFIEEKSIVGPNYNGYQAIFNVKKGNHNHLVYPEKRLYTVGKMAMTESDIDFNLFRDIYIALGEPLGDKSWSVRLYYKPFVRWIWMGGIWMCLGGLLSIFSLCWKKNEA